MYRRQRVLCLLKTCLLDEGEVPCLPGHPPCFHNSCVLHNANTEIQAICSVSKEDHNEAKFGNLHLVKFTPLASEK